jgi:hypothetical protein
MGSVLVLLIISTLKSKLVSCVKLMGASSVKREKQMSVRNVLTVQHFWMKVRAIAKRDTK